MILISSLIGLSYTILIASFYYGLQKKAPLKTTVKNPLNCFSLLIAFRNEATNLPVLLNSLKELKYPTTLFEIIFIDDHSEDASSKIIETFSAQNSQINISIVSNEKTGKKAAISLGIKQSKFDWILTTDADCKLPKLWIASFDNLLQEKDYKFIAGPVALSGTTSFLYQFQNIDFLSLQGSTIGSFSIGKPFMCNAANSGFNKVTFQELRGFNGNLAIASGDDVFLLEKMVQEHPTKIGFLHTEEAIVETKSQNSWKQLINQRMRWAAKATAYKNAFGIFVGTVIFSSNILLLILAVLNTKLALSFFLGKLIIDYLLILKTANFFSKKTAFGSYLITSFMYPIFSVLIFLSTLLFQFEWKGRVMKK
jgi:cellulose synthase/poly-beta-1,6-N-acetylglucosamine synthase-like glycosyltransferase